MVASDDESFNSFVFAETFQACALIGVHLLAAEGEAGCRGSQSPGDMWRDGCPQRPKWISSCSASETSLRGVMSTTTGAGPFKSLGSVGQAKW